MAEGASLTKLINNLKRIRSEGEKMLASAITEYLPDMAQMQRTRLEEGRDAKGDRLERNNGDWYPYSPRYAAKRKKLGLQTDHVDLKVTGAFHKGISAKKTANNAVRLGSSDEKSVFLEKQYDDIFGFDRSQQERVQVLVGGELESNVRRLITAQR